MENKDRETNSPKGAAAAAAVAEEKEKDRNLEGQSNETAEPKKEDLQSPRIVGEENREVKGDETGLKHEEGEVKDDEKIEERTKEGEIEAWPEIRYTLESLSKEIDQFVSSLASSGNDVEPDRKDEGKDDRESSWIEIPQDVGKFLDLFEEKIAKHDSGEAKVKWCGPADCDSREEDHDSTSSFLEAVDRVSDLMNALREFKPCSDHHAPLINHTAVVHQRAMSFLEAEFRSLLEECRAKGLAPDPASRGAEAAHHNKKEDPKLGDHDQDQKKTDQDDQEKKPEDQGTDSPEYSQEIQSALKKITGMMEKGGYRAECQEVYLVTRRNLLEQTLKEQGFDKVSVDEVMKMQWEALEREIPTWNNTFRDCATTHFPGERQLADEIFPAKKEQEDTLDLFTTITRSLMFQFLAFAEAVVMTKRAQEKLFKVLDIYETLRDYFPAMERLFPEKEANELRSEAMSVKCRLGEMAISIFSDLECSIKSDYSKTPVPGGAIHPLTRYTMNYLKLASDYKDTLEQVFKEHSKIERADSTSRPRYEAESFQANPSGENNDNGSSNEVPASPFSKQLTRIMDFLDANLEGKSKLYRDVALSCIFMMNNGRYIVQKIKGSPEIHEVVGDTWCRKRSSDLRNYHKNYQRETWGKLLGCMAHEGLMNNGKIVKPNLKSRFKSFNAIFDDIIKTQSSWVVNDEQLQSELRVSITAVVIPAYRSFLGRFAQHLDPGRQTEKYIKYQPEDIEGLIDELFEGNASSSTMARRKT